MNFLNNNDKWKFEYNKLYRKIRKSFDMASKLTPLPKFLDVTIYNPDSEYLSQELRGAIPSMLLYSALLRLNFDYANWIIDNANIAILDAHDGGDTTILRYLLNLDVFATEKEELRDLAIASFVLRHPTFYLEGENLEDWDDLASDEQRKEWFEIAYMIPIMQLFKSMKTPLKDYQLIQLIKQYLA